MKIPAAGVLCSLAVLSAPAPNEDLPLEEWAGRVEELESFELFYEFIDEDGDTSQLSLSFRAPAECYVRVDGRTLLWALDGRLWMTFEDDEDWKTFVVHADDLLDRTVEWIEYFAEQIPHDHDFGGTGIYPQISIWPEEEKAGLRFNFQLLTGSRPLFPWLQEGALADYEVRRVDDGFEVEHEGGTRVLLGTELGIPIAAWFERDGEEEKAFWLERMTLDEGIDVQDPPEDAEDVTASWGRGMWVGMRAQVYRCLWRREFLDGTVLDDDERALVIESFRELHAELDASFLEQRHEGFLEEIEQQLTRLQRAYDEARENGDSTDELEERVKPSMESGLREALVALRDQYLAALRVPDLSVLGTEAGEEDLKDFLELEQAGASAIFDELLLEPSIDYLLEELERVGVAEAAPNSRGLCA